MKKKLLSVPVLLAVIIWACIATSAGEKASEIPSVSNWIANAQAPGSSKANEDPTALLQEYEGQINALTRSMKSKLHDIAQQEKAGKLSSQEAEVFRIREIRDAAETLDMVNAVYAGLLHSMAKEGDGAGQTSQLFDSDRLR